MKLEKRSLAHYIRANLKLVPNSMQMQWSFAPKFKVPLMPSLDLRLKSSASKRKTRKRASRNLLLVCQEHRFLEKVCSAPTAVRKSPWAQNSARNAENPLRLRNAYALPAEPSLLRMRSSARSVAQKHELHLRLINIHNMH